MIELAALLLLAPSAQDATVRARFVDPEGQPIPGVELCLLAGNAPPLATATAGADGQATLQLPGNYQTVHVRARRSGLASRTWVVRDLAENPSTDLGDVPMAPPGSLRGHVVDAEGAPLMVPWMIWARGGVTRSDPAHVTEQWSHQAHVDSSNGEFVFEDLPPGPVQVEAAARVNGKRAELLRVTVRAGHELPVKLHYFGPDPRRALLVRPPHGALSHEPLAPLTLEVRSRDDQVTRHEIQLRPGTGHVRIDELGEPPFLVSHVDDRFHALDGTEVPGGTPFDLELRGNVELRWTLVEEVSGLPIERAGLDLIREGHRQHLLPAETDLEVGQGIPGLFPGGPATFEVHVPGREPFRATSPPLPAGEVVDWRLELPPPSFLTLELLDGTGTPAAGVTVQLYRGDPDPRSRPLLWAKSDHRGRARIDGLQRDTYTLRAKFSPYRIVERRITPEDLLGPIRVQAPASGWLDLSAELSHHLRDPLQAAGIHLELHLPDFPASSTLPSVPVGRLPLRLELPAGTIPIDVYQGSQGSRHPLTTVEVVAGETRAADLDLTGSCPGRVMWFVEVDGKEYGNSPVVRVEGTPDRGGDARRFPVPHTRRPVVELPPGDYTLHMEVRGQWSVRERVRIEAGQQQVLRTTTTTQLCHLDLRDASTGRRLTNRRPTLRPCSGSTNWLESLTTGRNGEYVRRLMPGRYEVRIDGYEPTTFDLLPSRSEPTVIPLTLERRRDLSSPNRLPAFALPSLEE